MQDPRDKNGDDEHTPLEELNDEGVGLGASEDANTFEPEEEPDAG